MRSDTSFNTQRSNHPLLTQMRSQIALLHNDESLNLFVRLNPWRKYIQMPALSRKMHNTVVGMLRAKYQARLRGEAADAKKKSIVDLALETYMAEERPAGSAKVARLDPVFERYCADQIRVFLFAGHDTTSSTICWCLYMLSKHPEYRAKMVAEHDDVFGAEAGAAGERIRADPHKLSRLEYTLAFVKEVLRLFPAASGIRKGGPEYVERCLLLCSRAELIAW